MLSDNIVWVSRTGDPVGCVSTGWTGGVECGDYGGTVALTRAGSDESVTGVVSPTGPDGPVDGVAAGGTGKDGCHVYVRDICEGCCPVVNITHAPHPGEPCKPDEPDVIASQLNRLSLSLWLIVSIWRWPATN